MLPNHAPLVIAEQFGTLEALYPGRIDLGLGRAPGTDQLTARALRRTRPLRRRGVPAGRARAHGYFDGEPGHPHIPAVPGAGTGHALWLLGSSLFGAQLAAALGLPFAFASHFAPATPMPALQVYRERFRPSAQLDRPYVMLGVNVIAADTDERASWLVRPLEQLAIVRLRSGRLGFHPARGGRRLPLHRGGAPGGEELDLSSRHR